MQEREDVFAKAPSVRVWCSSLRTGDEFSQDPFSALVFEEQI